MPALRAFLAIATQWRVIAPAGGGVFYLGLDYQGARAGIELAGMSVTPDLWSDVQLIEQGACSALNRMNR